MRTLAKTAREGEFFSLKTEATLSLCCSPAIALILLVRSSYSLRHVENGPFWGEKRGHSCKVISIKQTEIP